MSIGIKPPTQHTTTQVAHLLWDMVEDADYDSLWTFDHFEAVGPEPEGDVFDGWTLLPAMAEATTDIRLGVLVTGNTYRHPAVLAKMATTVDHLSAGRLDVGLGAGGHHPGLGLPSGTEPISPRELLGRFDESCRILKRLWTQSSVTFEGEHYRLDGALANPKPLQTPHPPLWLGSSGERGGLRVVAEHADVWINANRFGTPVEEISRLSAVVDGHCETIGRDPAEIRRAVQLMLDDDPETTLREAESFSRAGFTEIIIALRGRGEEALGAGEAAVKLLPRLRSVVPT